ncbi:hypothetical protein NHH03_02060 [Stieleria sp. TO1_6]|uniref:hypothetical protein n=1 Tax=Stieleria tagensis TaxID=2956795 RepID=UPI00209B6CBA|nr:hypothetical protein [Stieleria tagensis]MCO8120506.1 hypothetical protein [Stieleria tagensis]
MTISRFQMTVAICAGILLGSTLVNTTPSVAQEPAAAAAETLDPSSEQHTQFAPGVVTVIPSDASPEETFDGPLTLKTFLAAHPELEWKADKFPGNSPHFDPRSRTLVEMAKQVVLRREVYCLEFSFKPLRQMYIDVPVSSGRLQRKLVWYMVYRVRYRGNDLRPVADEVGGSKLYQRLETISYESRRFFPLVTLKDRVGGQEYLDRILPSAKAKIAAREQITAPLYNSVEIARQPIPYSSDENAPGVWGVLTWMDVNPSIDYLSLYVSGLTNAFQQDGEGDDAPYRRKALQLNFFRPGDAMGQTEDTIRFGVPSFEDEAEQAYILEKYNQKEPLHYRWVFRTVN